MIVFPKAKINIGLRITGKRPDGFHDIETLFYPIGLTDALEYVSTDQSDKFDILTVSGINTGGSSEDNLVLKALKKLREKYLFPYLKIHLHKAIPVGAGLGGGSSDAAYILNSINKFFCLRIEDKILKEIALEIGSDCPFFINALPSYGTGRGEILETVKPFLYCDYLVLINPGIVINTREAYQNCTPNSQSISLKQLIDRPFTDWKNDISNDFEDFAFRRYPVIRDLKSALYNCGALFSSMSGSGSSVYGIFKEKPDLPHKVKDFVIFQGLL